MKENNDVVPKLQLFLSQISGDIYAIEDDEIDNIDEYQIPLKKRPADSCKKCHGRGWNGKHIPEGTLVLCVKCLRKCIDFELLKELSSRLKEKNEKPTRIVSED